MMYPKIYLAIDNCFALKRWTRPLDWAKVIKDLGITYIEASADNELDPLFMGEQYLMHWIDDVKKAEQIIGIKVANLYSGHGTYCTLGLAHTDESVRTRIKEKWFKPLIETAAKLFAGIGFFAHAFADYILQDPDLYGNYLEILYNNLSELNEYAGTVGCGNLGVEQMYSPHQVPWRIEETRKLLKEVVLRSKRNFYFTEDVGHHQMKFVKPTAEQIISAFNKFKEKNTVQNLWLGTNKAYDLFKESKTERGRLAQSSLMEILNEIDRNSHMFAEAIDGDCYEWLRRLGCYSPIIHLQQTDGFVSAHKHFTPENNKWGKIEPLKLLKAIKESYDIPVDERMPQRCEEIYLTLEAFTSTASINHDTLQDYKTSVEVWRQFIPYDGIRLDHLIKEEHNESFANQIQGRN